MDIVWEGKGGRGCMVIWNSGKSYLEIIKDCSVVSNQLHCFVVFVQDESVPYSFFINESEITGSLQETLESQTLETEKVVEIVYQPQAVFKVRAVTRCTSTIPGTCTTFMQFVPTKSFHPNLGVLLDHW